MPLLLLTDWLVHSSIHMFVQQVTLLYIKQWTRQKLSLLWGYYHVLCPDSQTMIISTSVLLFILNFFPFPCIPNSSANLEVQINFNLPNEVFLTHPVPENSIFNYTLFYIFLSVFFQLPWVNAHLFFNLQWLKHVFQIRLCIPIICRAP